LEIRALPSAPVHPIAFKLGTWPIHWYGVLVALGFLAGLWTASRRAPRYGLKSEHVADCGPWLIVGALLGARGLYVATYWKESFAPHPWTEIFMVQNGGLVFYGGFIGACVALIIYCRVRHIPIWKLADALAPSIPLGYVFGRLGCFMNGCCFGTQCAAPWAVTYPRGHETFKLDAAAATPVHPTQIYDSLLGLALYLFLAWLYRRKKFDGQVFAAYLICYAFARSAVERFRGDYTADHIYRGFLTPAQLVSAGILLAGIILFVVLRNQTSKPRTANSK
jgi:phosphatidylglycerol:prolipoprotein diacylglycerol transferase